MIFYNIRRNGPYEYDKFILNIAQIHNAVVELQLSFPDDDFTSGKEQIDEIYDSVTGEDSVANTVQILCREYM